MKFKNTQYITDDEQEFEILSEQLSVEDMSILKYLKDFNRSNMKEWAKKRLANY